MFNFIRNYVPAPNGTSANTLLLLHGTGGDEHDLVPLGRLLNPDANLLSPRGRVLENGMPRFFKRLSEGVFDIPDLIAQTEALSEFVAEAAEAYGFDPSRVTAAGFSNGANIAAALLLLHPGVLHAAILLHPMVPLVPDTLPDLAGIAVFIGAGRRDPIVPEAETERLAALTAPSRRRCHTFLAARRTRADPQRSQCRNRLAQGAEHLILGIHHVQITVPEGQEDDARAFYCGVLGLAEAPKPEVHVGTEAGVDRAATKAHLAYKVSDIGRWRQTLEAHGIAVLESIPIPGCARFEFRDPFGNRVELIQPL